eukprot:CAMPEP_0118894258 /NCGR_PEP_ID=MMETSP1166-20130328/3112_1 /TAXON_ID=1104430 /ORGANISM="Chrysoreinhardia sp, Strain CCMP3193" /LENGTH=474 /DNA_ID=CAMNT_0006833147 /DNA_START=148 /DNA_END=1572 /DNA_ORIENTATION=+
MDALADGDEGRMARMEEMLSRTEAMVSRVGRQVRTHQQDVERRFREMDIHLRSLDDEVRGGVKRSLAYLDDDDDEREPFGRSSRRSRRRRDHRPASPLAAEPQAPPQGLCPERRPPGHPAEFLPRFGTWGDTRLGSIPKHYIDWCRRVGTSPDCSEALRTLVQKIGEMKRALDAEVALAQRAQERPWASYFEEAAHSTTPPTRAHERPPAPPSRPPSWSPPGSSGTSYDQLGEVRHPAPRTSLSWSPPTTPAPQRSDRSFVVVDAPPASTSVPALPAAPPSAPSVSGTARDTEEEDRTRRNLARQLAADAREYDGAAFVNRADPPTRRTRRPRAGRAPPQGPPVIATAPPSSTPPNTPPPSSTATTATTPTPPDAPRVRNTPRSTPTSPTATSTTPSAEPPDEFVCPITRDLIEEPSFLLPPAIGHGYEHNALRRWLQSHPRRDPLTNTEHPTTLEIGSDLVLAAKIAEWKEQH